MDPFFISNIKFNLNVDLPHKKNEEPQIFYLNYSRVEVAVEARRKGCSCSYLPQILCNEAYTMRSAGRLGRRLKGKKCRL